MRLTPYPHQKAGTQFLIDNYGGAIFSDPRTGKTLMVTRAIEHFNFTRNLIVAPSTVLASWYGALLEEGIPAEKMIVYDGSHRGTVDKLRSLLILNKYHYHIINYEKIITSDCLSVRKMLPEVLGIRDWESIILDESYRIANYDTNISKEILSHKRPERQFRAILTGTPICESPLDVVQPYTFLNNEFFGYSDPLDYRINNYNLFGYNDWKAKSRIHKAKVESFVKNNSFQVKLADLNLGGEILYGTPIVPKSEKIVEWLGWLATTTIYEKQQTGEILDLIPPVRVMFAQKICAGINPLTDEIFDTSKAEWIADLIEEDHIPSLITSRFKKPLEIIKNLLTERGLKSEIINGDVSLSSREKIRKKFQDGKLDAVVAQGDTVARGLDFSRLGRIINHSNSFSYEVRGQLVLRGQNVKRKTPYEVMDVCIEDSIDFEVVDKLFKKREEVSKFIKEYSECLKTLQKNINS